MRERENAQRVAIFNKLSDLMGAGSPLVAKAIAGKPGRLPVRLQQQQTGDHDRMRHPQRVVYTK